MRGQTGESVSLKTGLLLWIMGKGHSLSLDKVRAWKTLGRHIKETEYNREEGRGKRVGKCCSQFEGPLNMPMIYLCT